MISPSESLRSSGGLRVGFFLSSVQVQSLTLSLCDSVFKPIQFDLHVPLISCQRIRRRVRFVRG